MADEDRRRNIFVAIDRATRWVFVRIYRAPQTARQRCAVSSAVWTVPHYEDHPGALLDKAIGRSPTDCSSLRKKRSPTGQHEFYRLCADLLQRASTDPPMRPADKRLMEERSKRSDRGSV